MTDLGVIDSFGLSGTPDRGLTGRDEFAIASLGKTAVLHRTSLELDDSVRLFGPSRSHLFVIADGASDDGDRSAAAKAALDALVRYFLAQVPTWHQGESLSSDVEKSLFGAMEDCRAELARRSGDEQDSAVGVTLAFVLWPSLWVAHIGLGRCCLRRAGELREITDDHSVAGELRAGGRLTANEARRSPFARVTDRLLDDSSSFVPDVHHVELQMGDELLVCSKGLAQGLDHGSLTGILLKSASSRDACERLVGQAVRDARDEVTSIVARFLPRDQEGVGEGAVPASEDPSLSAAEEPPGKRLRSGVRERARRSDADEKRRNVDAFSRLLREISPGSPRTRRFLAGLARDERAQLRPGA